MSEYPRMPRRYCIAKGTVCREGKVRHKGTVNPKNYNAQARHLHKVLHAENVKDTERSQCSYSTPDRYSARREGTEHDAERVQYTQELQYTQKVYCQGKT